MGTSRGERFAGHLGDAFDVTVTDIEYVIDREPNPAWRIQNFVNARSNILAYALSGRAHYQIDGDPYAITRGALIFMPRTMVHTASSDPEQPWHFLSVAFDLHPDGADSLEPLWELPTVSYGLALELGGMFRDMYAAWTQKTPGYQVKIRGLVSTILYEVINEHSLPARQDPHARRIAAVTKMLRENYASSYSVEELAAQVGLSPSHFRLMFKRVTGMTATAYQQNLKITKAIEFLASGEYNVTETARRTGFRDVYYFSRLFRKLTGSNPSAISK